MRLRYGKCMLCQVLGFPFVSVCTRTHCPFIAPKSSDTFGGFRRNEWAVGTRAYTHKRKAQNLTEHAFPIQSDQFCNFSFLTLPPIYSPCTRPSETILTN